MTAGVRLAVCAFASWNAITPLLTAATPYVPITDRGGHLTKVIDRVGVAEIARHYVESRLGR